MSSSIVVTHVSKHVWHLHVLVLYLFVLVLYFHFRLHATFATNFTLTASIANEKLLTLASFFAPIAKVSSIAWPSMLFQ